MLGVYSGNTVVAEYEYDAFGNILESSETGISNPIRYAGYYFDEYCYKPDETVKNLGNYYLHNRYYNSKLSRFLTEDTYWNTTNMLSGNKTEEMLCDIYYPALVQSGNRYAYCGNNPIILFDTTGMYYITQNVQYYIDKYGIQRRSLGTYTLNPETWITSTAKAATEFIPFGLGNVAIFAVENCFNVVCGNSKTDLMNIVSNFAMGIVEEGTTFLAQKVGGELFKSGIGSMFTMTTLFDVITKENTVLTYDNIAFDLLKRNNISLTSNSMDELNLTMSKTYQFINYFNEYFLTKIDGISTLFEIDNHLNNEAWWPERDKKNYVERYSYNLTDFISKNSEYFYLNGQKTEAIEYYSELLSDYKGRSEHIDEIFVEFMNS